MRRHRRIAYAPAGDSAALHCRQHHVEVSHGILKPLPSEAILPADIMWKSPRVKTYQEGEADEARQLELDSMEEVRCNALLQSERYLQGVRRYHDRNVQQRSFNVEDMVLRRI